MANRFLRSSRVFSQFQMPVMIEAKAVIGAAGAVSSYSGSLVASVTKTGTGKYLITLNDAYASMIHCSVTMKAPAASVSGIVGSEILAESVASAKTIEIQVLDAAGALADPASGSQIHVNLMLNNGALS